jgi:hypothetical protein
VKTLASPSLVAGLSLALAALVHAAPGSEAYLRLSTTLVASLALLLVMALVLQAKGWRGALFAAGTVAVAFSLGYNALAGHQGSLTLGVGQTAHLFDEAGPQGPLGYRPLGFEVTLDGLRPDGAALRLRDGAGEVLAEVTRERALGRRGFRLASPETLASGEALLLRLTVSRQGETREVELAPGVAASFGDMDIALQRYFPDFALDSKGNPYSRSPEALNPAALLRVRRGGKTLTVFVIRAFPGIHQQEGLGASFALAAVEPALAVRMRVFREPAAAWAGLGLLAAALSLVRVPKRS